MNFELHELPFRKTLAVLFQPEQIEPTNCYSESDKVFRHEISFNFNLTPEQFGMLGRDKKITLKVLISTKANQEASSFSRAFLPILNVNVNGKYQGFMYQQHDLVLYGITTPDLYQVKLSWMCTMEATPYNFMVGIYLFEIVTVEAILEQVRMNVGYHFPATLDMIRNSTSTENGDVLAASTVSLSFICPVGRKRMTNPIRARTCTHLQTFDAEMFLTFQEAQPFQMLKCPICRKPINVDDLAIDWYLRSLLERPDLQDQNEIKLDQQGNEVASDVAVNNVEVVELEPRPRVAAQSEIEVVTLD